MPKFGGWCIGTAWPVFFTVRRWDWKLVHPDLLYLLAFWITELIVLCTT